jgi:hypothetical protein
MLHRVTSQFGELVTGQYLLVSDYEMYGLRPEAPVAHRSTSRACTEADCSRLNPMKTHLRHHRGLSQDRARYPGSGIRPSTLVPYPGSLETSRIPPIASRRSTIPCIPVP